MDSKYECTIAEIYTTGVWKLTAFTAAPQILY